MESGMSGFAEFTTLRLVKSEDLNHHQTLFAGRGAEWFVESGFIAAASYLPPERIVCVSIHGMRFRLPVRPGQIARFSSRIVLTGRTSLTAYVRVTLLGKDDLVVDGFVTFVHVDEHTRPEPHGISLDPATDEERALRRRAESIVEQSRREGS
jgi:acyl-CoA hydrolase